MKKILFSVFFIVFLFTIKSAFASNGYAATLGGNFDNRKGSIAITVNYSVKDNNGSSVSGSPFAIVVPAGNILSISVTLTTANYPSLSWWTNCNSGSPGISTDTTGTYTYTFQNQDVHCTTTNSTLTITSYSCSSTGNFSINWSVTNIGSDGANISYFNFFASNTGSADSATPIRINYTSGTTTYSASGSGWASGTWNLAVKAYPPNSDPGIASVGGSVVCGSGTSYTNPYNLQANPFCYSSTAAGTKFTWNAAAPGSWNYTVQYNLSTDPGVNSADSSWPNSIVVSTTDLTYANVNTLALASTYWWRVKAVSTTGSPTLYPVGDSSFTTPSSCSGATSPPTISNISICYDMSSTPHANQVNVQWSNTQSTNGLTVVTGQNFIDYGTDSSMGAFTSVSGSGLLTITDNAFNSNNTFYFRARMQMSDTKWYSSVVTPVSMTANCQNNVGQATPFLTAYSDCQYIEYSVGSPLYYPEIHLHWSKMANDTNNSFYVLRNGATPNPAWTNPTTAYYWFSGPYSVGAQANTQDVSGGSATWQVYGFKDSDTGHTTPIYSNSVNLTNVDCSSAGTTAPSNPWNLSASSSCSGTNPSIGFIFYGPSGTAFSIEVSTQPFTGPFTTNPGNIWGVKQLAVTGFTYTFSWLQSSPLTSGNANPQTNYSPYNLVPLDGQTYYWRAKALNSNGMAAITYNDGTSSGSVNPSGIPVVAPVCKPLHDLSATIDTGPSGWFDISKNIYTNSFNPGDSVTAKVIVTNVSGANITTMPQSADSTNILWFYYNLASPPTACAGGIAPSGSTGTSLALGLPSGGLSPGASIIVPVTFTTPTTTANSLNYAYADVAPSCIFPTETPNPGADENPANNVSNASLYIISPKRFFETTGGDTAAVGKISVGQPSSTNPVPYYQSAYLLLGNNIDNNSKTTASGFKINNYPTVNPNTKLIPTGGVYNYFANLFLSKAKQNTISAPCTISGSYSSNFYYCSSDATIGSSGSVSLTGNPVFFIDGDLNIQGNVSATGTNSVVFIVKGSINVYFSATNTVTSIDGVYIAQKSFNDINLVGSNINGTATSSQKLLVHGSVYCDSLNGGTLNLARTFAAASDNTTYPSDSFQFDPKYLIVLNSILGKSEVGWQEVSP